jgi:hypothetical protein
MAKDKIYKIPKITKKLNQKDLTCDSGIWCREHKFFEIFSIVDAFLMILAIFTETIPSQRQH